MKCARIHSRMLPAQKNRTATAHGRRFPRRPGPMSGTCRPHQRSSMLLSAAVSPSPPPHLHAFLLLPLSRALLFVHHGLNIGLSWPTLLVKPRDVLIPAAISAPYLISFPALWQSLPVTAACQPPTFTPSLIVQQGLPLLSTNTPTLLRTLSWQGLSSSERFPVFKICKARPWADENYAPEVHACMWHCLRYVSHYLGNGRTLSFKKSWFLSF